MEKSSAYPVGDLRGFLAGHWRLRREAEDRASGIVGRFEGTLDCAEEGENALVMTEDGELDWSGVRRPAFRVTRLVVPGDDPGLGQVAFEDGRHFHDLDLRSGACAPMHPCAPDAYRGRFVVHGPDEWSYEWLVSGPRKDLRLTTRLTRQPPPNR